MTTEQLNEKIATLIMKGLFSIDTTILLKYTDAKDVVTPINEHTEISIVRLRDNKLIIAHECNSIEYYNSKNELINFDMTDFMPVYIPYEDMLKIVETL